MRRFRGDIFAALLTLLLLGGVWTDGALHRPPVADAQSYHQRVQARVEAFPSYVESWLSTDAPVPTSSIALLRPNVILSRRYQDTATGQSASMLLVQCKDARDLLGHWPPVCYVGQGWILRSRGEATWQVDDLAIPLVKYEFVSDRPDRTSRLVIENFFIFPDGRFGRDMKEVDGLARDRRRRLFGAAQVQIVTDGSISVERREVIFRTLLRSARPVIDAILEGDVQ